MNAASTSGGVICAGRLYCDLIFTGLPRAPSPGTEVFASGLSIHPGILANRFAPELKVMIHHGLERKQGDELVEASLSHDCVITTFALANRDRETLGWQRVRVVW